MCSSCNDTCSTCDNGTDCVSCKLSGPNRLGYPTCVCETGYIEDDDKNCI